MITYGYTTVHMKENNHNDVIEGGIAHTLRA